MHAHRHVPAAIAATLFLLLGAAACSDDTGDEVQDAVTTVQEEVADAADSVQARTTAETLRASLKANDTADEEGIRSVAAIREAADDLPGDPEITGIEDSDGDGLDDDGKVEVRFDEDVACLSLPESGDDTEVTQDSC